MGKNYRKELDILDIVYDRAMEGDVGIIAGFLSKYGASPLIGVGSGGSYSAAAAFEFLSTKAGLNARKITPLELGQLEFQLHGSAVVLFTASGSNYDSRNAYRYIAEHEPEGVLTCCMHIDAPIKKLQAENIHNYYYEYKMPVGRDGYLAVESLLSTMVLMARAFYKISQDSYFLLRKHASWDVGILDSQKIESVIKRESIFILYGGITMPAAVDLESKFSEASLANVQLVDFRNFAHGRHYWMSDRRDDTAIIALVGGSERKLADKTLDLLPDDIPVLRIDVDDGTINGMLDAFRYCFEIVGQASMMKGIDPGKPHIEDFGKKLYHLNYDIGKTQHMNQRRKDMFAMAAYRKASVHQGICLSEYLERAHAYWQDLSDRCYKGIIFDYDGTIHDRYGSKDVEGRIFAKINRLLNAGITIGIATGRGKSVRIGLREKIERRYWGSVLIAYYNGGVIAALDNDEEPDKYAIEMPEAFCKIMAMLPNYEIEANPYQITLLKERLDISDANFFVLKERISGLEGIKLMETFHSIDIVPVQSSKTKLVSAYGYSKEKFLKIGDSGQFGGNDYELLCDDSSLSADYVSAAFDSCWNYAIPGMRNLNATDYYLDMVDVQCGGTFCLRG